MKTIRMVLRGILIIIAAVGGIMWFRSEGGYESALNAVGALITLLGDFAQEESKPPSVVMKQTGGKKSVNNQSNGPMTINSK
jgi:hypothetical protein